MFGRTFSRYALGALIVCVAASTGCDGPRAERGPILLFPAPPDAPRIQFLTWASSATEVGTAQWTLDEYLLGDEAVDRRRMNKPYGIAARDGVVYVCDTKALCIAKLDFKEEEFTVFGTRGPGQLRKPLNIAIDSAGYKFVADVIREQIVVFGPTDEYVTAFTIPEPCHVVDVVLHGDELYVLDNDKTPQIHVLDRKTGEILRSFGEEGAEPGQFHIPGSIAVDPEGNIYVSDTLNWRIQKLTPEGESIWTKGVAGYDLAQFGRPRGIRVGPDGVVYLVDGATEIVQMFNGDGDLLMHFGGPGSTPGALFLPSTLAIDRTSIPYFKKYAHPAFDIDYLLFVVNQYGPHLVNIYGFGSFPEGFTLDASQITDIPDKSEDEGIGPVDGEKPPPLPEQPSDHPTNKKPG
jgi:sugar lactone lactonase YvrE